MMRGLSAGILLFGQLVWIASARADPSEEAAVIHEGIELRREGKDAEALEVFTRALALGGSVQARAQVGFAHQALGHWIEAERELSIAQSSASDPWMMEHRGVLESALAVVRTHLGWLDVEANVPGAELVLDGVSVGVFPLSAPVRIVSGSITIEVRARGFDAQRRTVHVAAQSKAREIVTLAKSPVAAPAPSVASSPVSPVSGAATSSTPPPVIRPTDGRAGARTAAWISLGTSVAFGGGAATAVVVREMNLAVYNDDQRCFYGGLTRDERCGGYGKSAALAQVLAIVGGGAFVAGAAASAVLFLVSSPGHRLGAEASPCQLGWGVQCLAHF